VSNRPQSVSWARSWVRAALTAHGLDDYIHTACLIVSELVSNSVQHADSHLIGIVCELADDGMLILGVIDDDQRPPVMLDASEDDERGRGIALIDAIADEWGCQPSGIGKLVYARLKVPEPAPDKPHLCTAPPGFRRPDCRRPYLGSAAPIQADLTQPDGDQPLPLPIREPRPMLPMPSVEALGDLDLLKRVKEGLERLE
jgi:anti-sigma regulatory factor (Ser/Thr protein kinase)